MYSEPLNSVDSYGQPPESCAEECKKLCEGKTVQELQQISDYFSKEARDLDNKIDSSITAEDFESLKKNDSEEEY